MGRWNKNRKPVAKIIILAEGGKPALIYDLDNGKLKPDGPKIFGTPGYGQINNNTSKTRTDRSSARRKKQNFGSPLEKNNTDLHTSQNMLNTDIKIELNQSIKALQTDQSKEIIFQQPSKDHLLGIPPPRSIYSPPPPLGSSDESSRNFTLLATKSLAFKTDSASSRFNTDIAVSMQDAELEPISFYSDNDVFDFEFLKQDDFLHATDMNPSLFDVDPLTGSLPEIDYLYQ